MDFFSGRYRAFIHGVQLFLVVTVLILSAVRLLTQPKGAPRTRANTMALGMSAKSLVILLYEILTEHVRSLKRYGSLKAYAILNALEIVFWGAVVVLMIQANIKYCVGTNCALSWVVVVLGIILNMLASYMAVVSYLDFRYYRANGVRRGQTPPRRGSQKTSPSEQTSVYEMEEGSGKKSRRSSQHKHHTRTDRHGRQRQTHHSSRSSTSNPDHRRSHHRHGQTRRPPPAHNHRSYQAPRAPQTTYPPPYRHSYSVGHSDRSSNSHNRAYSGTHRHSGQSADWTQAYPGNSGTYSPCYPNQSRASGY